MSAAFTIACVLGALALAFIIPHAINDLIRRAYSVRSEHMMRAENAGQLEDILRARLREASATEQPPAPALDGAGTRG